MKVILSKEKSNGFGRYIQSNGTVYQGDFIDDKKAGFGKTIMVRLNSSDNDSYELERYYCHKGFYSNNKANGPGVRTWQTGKKFKGEFVNDELHWEDAIIYYPDGTIYKGCAKKDQRHGKGKLTFKDKSTYRGNFFGDRMHGIGTYRKVDEDGEEIEIYKGPFYNNLRHGRGTLIIDGISNIVEYNNGILKDGDSIEISNYNVVRQNMRISLTTGVTLN